MDKAVDLSIVGQADDDPRKRFAERRVGFVRQGAQVGVWVVGPDQVREMVLNLAGPGEPPQRSA